MFGFQGSMIQTSRRLPGGGPRGHPEPAFHGKVNPIALSPQPMDKDVDYDVCADPPYENGLVSYCCFTQI